ncbi:hypothetical protein [Rhizobium herbae]|uniref:hypothetical protein n=1 Tax=Rhizobium herbae TaxID=508661 RepID=UPI001AE96AB9|nr:hypothetical protein [Rhizobium herbae]
MERPVDLWEVIYGYILAVPAGFLVWAFTKMLAAGMLPSIPGSAGVLLVFLLPFALAAIMVLGLPFTLAFLWVMRYFGIRSLSVLLLGGAMVPSAAIFFGQSLVSLFSNLTTGRLNPGPLTGLQFETVPAGMIAAYTLYRVSLRPCFEKGIGS